MIILATRPINVCRPRCRKQDILTETSVHDRKGLAILASHKYYFQSDGIIARFLPRHAYAQTLRTLRPPHGALIP